MTQVNRVHHKEFVFSLHGPPIRYFVNHIEVGCGTYQRAELGGPVPWMGEPLTGATQKGVVWLRHQRWEGELD